MGALTPAAGLLMVACSVLACAGHLAASWFYWQHGLHTAAAQRYLTSNKAGQPTMYLHTLYLHILYLCYL